MRKESRWAWLWLPTLLAGVLIWGAPAPAAMRALVIVQPQAKVTGESVTLGEIARIETSLPALTESLKQLILGRAPNAGEQTDLSALVIRQKVMKLTDDPESITLIAPDMVRIEREAVEVTQDQIAAMVETFILENMPWEPSRVTVSGFDVSESVKLPHAQIDVDVQPTGRPNFLGRSLFNVIFRVDKRIYKQVRVSVFIEVVADVVVAGGPIYRGQVVEMRDLRIEKRPLSRLSGQEVVDPSDAVGRSARRYIDEGATLQMSMVEFPALVRRGDLVTLVAETDQLRISTIGQVRRDGRKGEVVEVMNMTSGKVVYGQVRDANTVQVMY